MKYKKLFIAAAILLALGIIFMLFGAASAGFDKSRLSSEDYTLLTRSFEGEYDEIIIDDSNVSIQLLPTNGALTLECYESENETYTITDDNGRLRIVKHKKLRLFNFDFFSFSPTLTLYLPGSFDGSIDVVTSNAGICAEGLSLGESRIVSSNGRIELIGCEFGELEAITSNASIILGSCRAASAELTSSNGSVSADDFTVAGKLTASTSNSPIKLTNVSAVSLNVETSNAAASLDMVSAPGIIKIENSNGAINLTDISAQELDAATSNGKITVRAVDGIKLSLSTSNADISGVLVGKLENYTISSSTSNGSNTLPSSLAGGSRSLTVKNSNADVNVSFDGSDGCLG